MQQKKLYYFYVMNWQDKGFLISINKYSENSAIANCLTKNHGMVSGIIFGATSKKNKNYLILGNELHLNYSSKNENKIGNFKIEIINVNTPLYFDNRLKLSSIIYSLHIIKILTPENQINYKIYELLKTLFNILQQNKWIQKFVLWELELFKSLGYEINFLDYSVIKSIDGINEFVLKSDQNKIIPKFLIDKEITHVGNSDLLRALNIVGDFLTKSILYENNMSVPESRNDIINQIKNL